MHRSTTFVAMWSFAVFVIDRVDRGKKRRGVRQAGLIACYAATAGIATEPIWIDRLGRVPGMIWISLLIVHLCGYTG